jgi:small subunit ribosomal protein S16
MSVRLRLRRMGATNDVFFRVVAADGRSPRDGKFIEVVGWYDPKKTGKNFKLKMDRIDHWIGEGAEVSDTVSSLIKRNRNEPDEPVAEVAAPEKPEPKPAEASTEPEPVEAEPVATEEDVPETATAE